MDTDAEMTWLPEADLRSAGVETFKRDQLFVMANGQYVTRHVGMAVIECGEFKTVDEVVFAQPGDLSLLGARTLEGFNAHVDSRKERLVAAGPIPAARVRSAAFRGVTRFGGDHCRLTNGLSLIQNRHRLSAHSCA